MLFIVGVVVLLGAIILGLVALAGAGLADVASH